MVSLAKVRSGSRGLQIDPEELTKAVTRLYELLEQNFKISSKGVVFYFSRPKRTLIKTQLRFTHPYEGHDRRVVVPVHLVYRKHRENVSDDTAGLNGSFVLDEHLPGSPGHIEIEIVPRVVAHYSEGRANQLFLELRKVLLHELVHFFDKSLTSPKNRPLPEGYHRTEHYYREPPEALAVLNEFILETRHLMEVNRDSDPSLFNPTWILDKNEAWRRAKDDLTPKQKKKFMRALGALYQEWRANHSQSKVSNFRNLAARVERIARDLSRGCKETPEVG